MQKTYPKTVDTCRYRRDDDQTQKQTQNQKKDSEWYTNEIEMKWHNECKTLTECNLDNAWREIAWNFYQWEKVFSVCFCYILCSDVGVAAFILLLLLLSISFGYRCGKMLHTDIFESIEYCCWYSPSNGTDSRPIDVLWQFYMQGREL